MRPASKRGGPFGRTAAIHTPPPSLPPSAFIRPPEATQYWGTVYSVDRGRKLGATFAQPGADGLPPVVYSDAVDRLVPPRPRPEKPVRVFIGKVQRSWGFGRHPYVVNIPPPALPSPRRRHRGAMYTPGRLRCIVGSADVLCYHVRGDAHGDDLLAGLSPLTSIYDSDSDGDGDDAASEHRPAATAASEGTDLLNFSPDRRSGN